MDDIKLLPCPFCGKSNVKTFGPYGWYRQYGISHSCALFYNGSQEMAQGFHSEAAAIEAWNTRSTGAFDSEKVEALRALVSEDAIYLTGAEKPNDEAAIFVTVADVLRARQALTESPIP